MIQDPDSFSRPLDYDSLFGRRASVEIEIGVGKGMFTRQYALSHPDLNLIGIEKSAKWLRHAAIRLEKASVTNVRLFNMCAETFLREWIPSESIANFHIYFPDRAACIYYSWH